MHTPSEQRDADEAYEQNAGNDSGTHWLSTQHGQVLAVENCSLLIVVCVFGNLLA